MALGFDALGQGPLGDSGTQGSAESGSITTTQVVGSTVVFGLVENQGIVSLSQLQYLTSTATVATNIEFALTQVQQVGAVALVVNNGVLAIEQTQFVSAIGFVVVDSAIDTSQVQFSAVAGTVETSGTISLVQIQQTIAVAELTITTDIDTEQLQFVNAIIELENNGASNVGQVQTAAATATVITFVISDTTQLQNAHVDGTVTLSGTASSAQLQTIDVVADIELSGISTTLQSQQTNGTAAVVVYGTVETANVQTTRVPEVIYGSVETAQTQITIAVGKVVKPPIPPVPLPSEVHTGSGPYHGPYGAPFLIPYMWPVGDPRRRQDRIAIAIRLNRMSPWNEVEYNIGDAQQDVTVVATIPTTAHLTIAMPVVNASLPSLIDSHPNLYNVKSSSTFTEKTRIPVDVQSISSKPVTVKTSAVLNSAYDVSVKMKSVPVSVSIKTLEPITE